MYFPYKNGLFYHKHRLFCHDGNSYIFSKLLRGNPDLLFEVAVEVESIFKAEFKGDFLDRLMGEV